MLKMALKMERKWKIEKKDITILREWRISERLAICIIIYLLYMRNKGGKGFCFLTDLYLIWRRRGRGVTEVKWYFISTSTVLMSW